MKVEINESLLTLVIAGIVWIVLKLCGVISFPWLLVCAPFCIITLLVLIKVTLSVYISNIAKKKGRW